MTSPNRLPPPEASNIELDNRSGALIEFATRLQYEKVMTFVDADEIALRYDTVTADLLAYAEGSMNCVIDYAEGMVICP
jgi:hypothetical protein